jgi:hypothetical protein
MISAKLVLCFMMWLFFFSQLVQAGEPCCHVLICCRSTNDGIKFQDFLLLPNEHFR